MQRRAFLGTLASPLIAKRRYAPKLAVQGYIWQQHFGSRKLTLAEGLPEMLRGFREAGYKRVDLTNAFFTAELAERTCAGLKENGLELSGTYFGGPVHDQEAAVKTVAGAVRHAELAKSCGSRALTFNQSPKRKGERKSDAELAVQADALNRLGRELKAIGVTLGIHQHDPEMAENGREWRHILNNTDPDVVGFALDLDWVFRGGLQPMEILKLAGPRLRALHLRSSRNRIWSETLGDGDIDYRQVAAYLRRIGFDGYLVVELAYETATNPTRPLVENLRLSRLFAEKTFGVK